MRPALISRTNERLTCATTRKLRKRERRKPAIDDSSFNAGTSCGFDDCNAGMRLKRIPVAIESSSAKVSTRQSVRRSKSKVTSLGKRMPRTALLIAAARNTPAAPPLTEMRRLSVSSCLTTRCRLAPTARRTAISRRRSVARASSRLARFTHAEQNHERTHTREHSSKGEAGIFDIGDEQARLSKPNAAPDVLRIILREFRNKRLERSFRLRE